MNGTEYADAIADTVRELSELQRKMAEVEEEFSGQANTLEALQKKHELLREVLQKQTEKQEILTRILREAEQSQAAAGEGTEMLRQALSEAGEEISRTNQEILQNGRYMREAEGAADHCAASINRYGEETQAAREGTESLTDSLKKAVTENLAPKVSDTLKELAGSVFETAKGMMLGSNKRSSTIQIFSTLKISHIKCF